MTSYRRCKSASVKLCMACRTSGCGYNPLFTGQDYENQASILLSMVTGLNEYAIVHRILPGQVNHLVVLLPYLGIL